MEMKTRKKNRLRGYDYSTPGAYFLTVCTADKKNIFWDHTKKEIITHEDIPLSLYGNIVRDAIQKIQEIHPFVTVNYYAIMPNHVHLLLQIHTDQNGERIENIPSVDSVINQMKGYVTKKSDLKRMWQKSFHDHVIRNREDYENVAKYIYENPMHWNKDCFYTEDAAMMGK